MAIPRQQDVERIARTAITARLGYHQDNTVIECVQQGAEVLLHVNSGGNAITAENALTAAGYEVASGDPVTHGVKLRVVSDVPVNFSDASRCPNC